MSVVVPTFRRLPRLRLALAGLARQHQAPPFELIVVDNDPAASARAVVGAFPSGAAVSCAYVCEQRSGAVHARNRGIATARGDIVAMMDDDVVPAEDWLRRLVAPVIDGDCDAVGGRVLLDPAVPRPRWFDEPVVGQYLTNFNLGPEPRQLGDGEFVVTASAAVRRDLLMAIGGFATHLGPRGTTQLVSDDVQLVRALQAHGGLVRWEPRALVVHELSASRLNMRWILRRAYLQGRSDWLVDADELSRRRGNGVAVAGSWLRGEVRRRAGEGLRRPDVAFHLACDLARTVGRLREAVVWHWQ